MKLKKILKNHTWFDVILEFFQSRKNLWDENWTKKTWCEQRGEDMGKKRRGQYMLTTWQEELWLKEQSHITKLSKPFLSSETFHFPFPLQGSTPKSQSFFPSLLPISFNAFTATTTIIKHKKPFKWINIDIT